MRTNLIANALILGFGTPTAWFIARRQFPGRALVVTLVELPLVLPPAVAGIGLLAAVGHRRPLRLRAARRGHRAPFTEAAVVLAVTFVASPFYIRQAIAAFEGVDPTLTDAARTLGAGPGRAPSCGSACRSRPAVCWRAGSWPSPAASASSAPRSSSPATCAAQTQTLTLTIYEQLESSLDVALAIGVLLVVLSGGVLLSYKILSSWRRSSSTSPSAFARSSSASA